MCDATVLNSIEIEIKLSCSQLRSEMCDVTVLNSIEIEIEIEIELSCSCVGKCVM